MSILIHTLLALQSTLGITAISGQIVDANGAAIPHAQVFLEPGLGGMIRDTISGDSGSFSFDDVAPGPVGLFAIAPGFGFEGQHLTIAVADTIPPIQLTLHPAAQIKGTIKDADGNTVQDARITRIGVKGNHKVGVPIAKLRQYGYLEPQSDAQGNFVLDNVPVGCMIDLKIGHASFAQEGVADVPAGTDSLKVVLYPGVLVEGNVVSRANNVAVAQAAILMQNAQPPHDTALARSNLQGRFSIRLKPGVYLYQATGSGMRSPGWERLTVTGERPVEHVRLAVAGTAQIRGNVRDALTSAPIRDVRVSLTTNGAPAAVTRTGPKGDFLFTVGEGENIVRLDGAPGYFPPELQDVKVSVLEGNAVELPGMWLKPLPDYDVVIVDDAGDPVPGALVSVLRPSQFGWHVADEEGKVRLQVQQPPGGGGLLARAEHPNAPQGAVFTLEAQQEQPGTVKLFPFASVFGQIVNKRGRPVSGATVGAFFPGETAEDAVLLWQTTSGPDGMFHWDAVVPGVPQRCAARLDEKAHGESETFNLSPTESKSLGDVEVPGAKSGESLLGTKLDWHNSELLCGTLPLDTPVHSQPLVVFYANQANAVALAETAHAIQQHFAQSDLRVILMTEGDVSCEGGSPVPILRGSAGTDATTLVLDRGGVVVLETNGMPPASLLQRLK